MQTKPRRWQRVTTTEISEISQALHEKGICYNGCTHEELVKRYGDDCLQHRRGFGWYKLVQNGEQIA